MYPMARIRRPRAPRGLILYQGPSRFDGRPIVAIATLESSNRKTGNMVQTWILSAETDPLAAVKSGRDASVCGTCPLRGAGCYVEIGRAPAGIYRAFRRGLYPVADAESVAAFIGGRDIRLGAYGDPGAVPPEVWSGLLIHARRHTGYSHGRPIVGDSVGARCMISVQSRAAAADAWSVGLRTFRAGADGPAPGEILCPADPKSTNRLTCIQCGLCDGLTRGRRLPSVFIFAHGPQAASVTAAG